MKLGAPEAAVGIVIAALVLLPEALAAVTAARANRLQTSMNLALGSALASIGLTIPTVAAVFIWVGQPLTLGIGPMETVLLALTLLVSTLTLSQGARRCCTASCTCRCSLPTCSCRSRTDAENHAARRITSAGPPSFTSFTSLPLPSFTPRRRYRTGITRCWPARIRFGLARLLRR